MLLLASIPVLTNPGSGAAVSLTVDASVSHFGAVLKQRLYGYGYPLPFSSKKLYATKEKYSAFNRELLAAYSAVLHFCLLLEGMGFTLFTDHKPLTHALFYSSLPWSTRLQRHLAYNGEFTSDIVHVPGPDNSVADALS